MNLKPASDFFSVPKFQTQSEHQELPGSARRYFAEVTTQLRKISYQDSFLIEVFYGWLGHLLSSGDSSCTREACVELDNYLGRLFSDGGFVPVSPLAPITKCLPKAKAMPEIYSSAYAYIIAYCLGLSVANRYKHKLMEYLRSCCRDDGWILSRDVSDTDAAKRFDIELSFNTFMGLTLATLLGLEAQSLPFNAQRVSKLIEMLNGPRYLTATYYSLRSVGEIGEFGGLLPAETLNAIVDFVIGLWSEEHGAFYEYTFDRVKVFSYRAEGSLHVAGQAKHRVHSDFNVPSINATYLALCISRMPRLEKLRLFVNLTSTPFLYQSLRS